MFKVLDNTYRMVSGIGEQQKHKYHKHVGRSGNIWYVADVPNKGDYIYVKTPTAEGFAGSILEFELVSEGGVDRVKGPWHSNSTSLLGDTGIDYTQCHYTKGVICKEMTFMNDKILCDGVIHFEEDWVLGLFNRIPDLAELKAVELGQQLRYHRVSNGGTISGYTNYKG